MQILGPAFDTNYNKVPGTIQLAKGDTIIQVSIAYDIANALSQNSTFAIQVQKALNEKIAEDSTFIAYKELIEELSLSNEYLN